jgi:uncharacterized protein YecT (DUF1311 family)
MRPLFAGAIALCGLCLTVEAGAQELCKGTEANDMLKDCLSQHYVATDRLMSDAHKAALRRAESSGRGVQVIRDWTRVLQDTHRKWLMFRDADCGRPIRFELMQQPELIGIMDLRCKIAHTEDRLKTLKGRNLKPPF